MTNILHLSLERPTPDRIRLDFGRGATAKSFVVGFDSIRTLVEDADSRFAGAKRDELVAMGRRLFDWLNGDQRFTDLLKSFPNSNEPVALAVSAPPELGHLPWEILHEGTEFLVMRRVRPVLPIRMRNVGQGSAVPPPANRPLRVLFMATSPENTLPVLDFEKEEGDILAAAGDLESPIELVVEESGTLKELGKTIQRTKRGAFDVVHLTGHADHREGQPVFLAEDDAGQKHYASPDEIADVLSEMPPLVFLSGCKTAEDVQTGAVRSLSEQLIERGARAVLGWARPVIDSIGIAAAKALYGGMSVGNDLFHSLAGTYRAMGKAEEELSRQFPNPVPSNWHLLRLFANESVPGAFVTTPDEDGRELPGRVSFLEDFADPLNNQMRAVSRDRFVGRRRLLQRCLKTLKSADRSGVVLHGLGGNGKTCIAARLCDRLGRDFTPIIHIGRLKESDLFFKLTDALLEEKHLRDILAGTGQPNDDPFEFRLKRVFRQAKKAFLFVLDDFEENYADGKGGYAFTSDGKPILDEEARRVMTALLAAVADRENKVRHRVVVTSRFELEGDFAARLVQEPVNGFKDADLAKLVSRLRAELDAKIKNRLSISKYDDDERKVVENEAVKIAGGNARLLRWLYDLIAEPRMDMKGIFSKMDGKQADLLEDILADEILKSQSQELKMFLGAASVFNHFAPRRAFEELSLEMAGVVGAFDPAVAIGLLETTPDLTGEAVFQVPKVVRNLLKPFEPIDQVKWHARAAERLFSLWWGKDGRNTIPLADELVRLARKGNLPNIAARVESFVQVTLGNKFQFKDAKKRLEALPNEALEDYAIKFSQARILHHYGDGELAESLFNEAIRSCPIGTKEFGFMLLHFADFQFQRGKSDKAIYYYQNKLLPYFKEINDKKSWAVIWGKIADILFIKGEWDEVLKIYYEKVIPVFTQIGEFRELAVSKGKIADVYTERGDLDKALRIRQEDQIDIYRKIGDLRELAITHGQISDLLLERGGFTEALRILEIDVLPYFQEISDTRLVAMTRAKIANIYFKENKIDEALRIRQFEVAPVFEKLGEIGEIAVNQGKIADILTLKGDFDGALQIREQEQLPVYKKIGNLREWAVTKGQIAGIYIKNGNPKLALGILEKECIPAFEKRNCSARGDEREWLI